MIASPSDTLSASAGNRVPAKAKIPATPPARTRGNRSLNATAGGANARAKAQTWLPRRAGRRAASWAVSVNTSQSSSRTRTHSSKKAALRGRGSSRRQWRGWADIARGTPGRPAPEPTSAAGPGGKGFTTGTASRESAMCRSSKRGRSPGETRSSRGAHRRTRAAYSAS